MQSRMSIMTPALFLFLLPSLAHSADKPWQCDPVWHFPAGDKHYPGKGDTEGQAIIDARINCQSNQGSTDMKLICQSTPSSTRCVGPHTGTNEPSHEKPNWQPEWCAMPKDNADVSRINALPLHSDGWHIKSRDNGEACLHVPKSQHLSKVYCKITDSEGQNFCRDTPLDPAGCPWFWTYPDGKKGYPPRILDNGAGGWNICIEGYNQSSDRERNLYIYGE